MTLRTPVSFTAGKRVVFDGTTYQVGDAVPNAAVKGLHNLSGLLSSRILISDAPIRVGTNRGNKRTPSTVSPGMRKGL